MRRAWKDVKNVAQTFLLRVREWCGDAAYERYRRTVTSKPGVRLLTPEQFYVQQLERRYSRPNRCC